jgi:hypothetical protein
VLVFVNTDLYPGAVVHLQLLAEGVPVAEAAATRTDQYRLEGPLPEAAKTMPAVELAVRADQIIWQDRRDDLPRDEGRTLLVGEAAVFRASP